VIGPIPSPIITEESRLKTQRISSSSPAKELLLAPSAELQPLISRTSDLPASDALVQDNSSSISSSASND
jgi:hypothetical protein